MNKTQHSLRFLLFETPATNKEKQQLWGFCFAYHNIAGRCVEVNSLEYNDEFFDEVVEEIVDDWILLELHKKEKYILGTNINNDVLNFCSNETKQSCLDIIKKVLNNNFTKEYIKNQDLQCHAHLFELMLELSESSCKLLNI